MNEGEGSEPQHQASSTRPAAPGTGKGLQPEGDAHVQSSWRPPWLARICRAWHHHLAARSGSSKAGGQRGFSGASRQHTRTQEHAGQLHDGGRAALLQHPPQK
jgi:hypothetical protein